MKKRNLVLLTITLIASISVLYFVLSPKTKVVTGNDIDISVDYIPAQKVVCIGKIELEKNVNYIIDLSAKSGDKIFVALSNSADVVDAQGEMWKQYYETKGKELEHTFTNIEKGNFYVYIGTKGEALENVEGKLSITR